MKKLAPFKKIITHPGKSHFDERMAVALALAANNCIVPVLRRDPSEDDLQNKEVLVLDQGGKVDSWSNNFDHHQLPCEHAPECAFSLVAEAIGMKEELEAFFGWFATWRRIDSKGPFQWAKEHGVDWGVASTLLNPDMDIVAEWWEEATGDTPVDEALVRRLKAKGEKILAAAAKFKTFCQEVKDKGLRMDVDGITVYDLRSFDANESLDNGDKLAKSDGVKGGVLVSQDNRGTGDSYYRREDDPMVNFAKCGDKPYTAFAHVGGFILKTKEAGTDIQSVIRDAEV
jgi:hypothetical protein